MAERDLGSVHEWRPGDRRSVTIGRRRVCVVRTRDAFYALNDTCPHHGASLALGTLGGTMLRSRPQQYEYGMEDCVIRCPWHGWEFELRTGAKVFDPSGIRVRTYPVRVAGERVLIEV